MFSAQYIPYSKTGSFSSIILDYIAQNPSLRPFFEHEPDLEGVVDAITARKKYSTNRNLLVEHFNTQYASVNAGDVVRNNILILASPNTFTITTAHQPNIFTGHLYFVYKILHTIKLAEDLSKHFPAEKFVPVYYMGSEDADLDELGEVTVDGKTYHWQTDQKGAVGRMKVDKNFIALINNFESQISVEKFGEEIIGLVKRFYTAGKTIEQATFEFVHELFGHYGLLVLLPDTALLKRSFNHIVRKEIKEEFSAKAVAETITEFPPEYKIQAAGRELNLFYLRDDTRERIEKVMDRWVVVNTGLSFNEEELYAELEEHPERFSSNVILRPVFQEVILPNIIFVGGGGELAYWLELKKVFEAVGVPYPVLLLRNSFLVADQKSLQGIEKLGLDIQDFFLPVLDIIKKIVSQTSSLQLSLEQERKELASLYGKVKMIAGNIDPTLSNHTEALSKKATHKLDQLEKKMLRAEKIKYEAEQRQSEKIKTLLFPKDGLQERVENIMPFYARYGKDFINMLYKHSLGLEQKFCILKESKKLMD